MNANDLATSAMSLDLLLTENVAYILRSYAEPRFVTHIDDMAIRALTEFYAESFPPVGVGGKAAGRVLVMDLSLSGWIFGC